MIIESEDIGTVHPLSLVEDDYEWLNLSTIPDRVFSPLQTTEFIQAENPALALVELMLDTQYLHFACKHILNIELLPFQCAILKSMWEHPLFMLIATRGGGKSYLYAIY